MPVTIAESKSLRGAAISDVAKRHVERTVFLAQQAVGNALEALGRGLSTLEESIWKKCFLLDPTPAAIQTVTTVLMKTYSGISSQHTVKLADDNYVAAKYGAFGGDLGAIHLNSKLFEYVHSTEERIWIYVHEATHKFAGTKDIGDSSFGGASKIAYLSQDSAIDKWDIKYRKSGLSDRTALSNADSYAAFVIGIWQCRGAS